MPNVQPFHQKHHIAMLMELHSTNEDTLVTTVLQHVLEQQSLLRSEHKIMGKCHHSF
jgi:hypothetical protein